MTMRAEQPSDLLTPAEVAAKLRVDPKTVTRWAQAGRISSIRTPGGHRRFYRGDIEAIMAGRYVDPTGDVALPEPGEEEEL